MSAIQSSALISTRPCSGPCNRSRPIADFPLRRDARDGHRRICRECCSRARRTLRQQRRQQVVLRAFRQIADTRSESAIERLADGLLRQFRGSDRTAELIQRFVEAEIRLRSLRGTRALRAIARVVYLANKLKAGRCA